MQHSLHIRYGYHNIRDERSSQSQKSHIVSNKLKRSLLSGRGGIQTIYYIIENFHSDIRGW